MKELFTALAKAQGQIEAAIKDRDNPAFRGSKYADLAAVWTACRNALSANGLAVVQFPIHSEDNRLHLETIVTHASGESLSRTFSVPIDKANAHGYGSAITYARRFCLAAAIGVVADEDDDGNAASKASGATKPDAAPKSALEDVPKGALKITAIGAAQAELTVEQQQRVENVLENVTVFLKKEEYEDALLVLDMAELDSDEKTALWSKLDSKHRSALTKTRDKLKETA